MEIKDIVEKVKIQLGKNYRGDEEEIIITPEPEPEEPIIPEPEPEEPTEPTEPEPTEPTEPEPEIEPMSVIITPEGEETIPEDTVVVNNLKILTEVVEMVSNEAAQWTNRPLDKKLLSEAWPVIVRCSCIAYLNRGAEGYGSQSELGQQNVYNDWIKIMHQQLTNRRYVM